MSIRTDIQDSWLASLQNEIGVLASNNMLKDLIIADLETRMSNDQVLIEALKERAFKAEDGNRELKDTIRTLLKSKNADVKDSN